MRVGNEVFAVDGGDEGNEQKAKGQAELFDQSADQAFVILIAVGVLVKKGKCKRREQKENSGSVKKFLRFLSGCRVHSTAKYSRVVKQPCLIVQFF